MTEIWIVCLAVATPIAGVVAFAIQIRTVRKIQLENLKLELEIKRLQKELAAVDRRIVPATLKEIKEYSDLMFQRGPNPGPEDDAVPTRSTFLSALGIYAVLALGILFLLYLGFDLYRIGRWLWSFTH